MPEPKLNGWLNLTPLERRQLRELVRFRPNPEVFKKNILLASGVVSTPITLIGALLGYVRSYNRIMRHKDEYPDFHPVPAIVDVAMVLGMILIWAVVLFLLWLTAKFVSPDFFRNGFLLYYGGINLALTVITYFIFRRWQIGMNNTVVASNKFGSARFAFPDELNDYQEKAGKGFYVGGNYVFSDKGHILTVAGTRGGKGTNLIIPNLLGLGEYQGSWVVIDPKGENAAITANYQRQSGKNVVVLNPWDLLKENVGEAQCYNPLDILADKSSMHLVDDAQIIAEMLVPIEANDKNKFFTDTARSIIAGLIMQIVTTQDKENRTLTTLWKWIRYAGDDWDGLIADMRLSEDPVNGEVIRNSGNEIVKLMQAGEETFGNILSTVLQSTDFLKSPALQKSLQSGFDPATLSDGNTALYIIIPADKLQSHARWLRLVVTTSLRAVVRKPNKRVCFLLDEFAALGYLPEIETALSTYAGFEITVWPILQSLIQLKSLYRDNWETFTANTTIKQYFSINDNFTAEYVSKAIGQTSHVITTNSWFGVDDAQSNARYLVTPDEVRRGSADYIFAFMGGSAPTYYLKFPYYKMPAIKDRAEENPYIKQL